jgi:hypothetical protein
VTLTRERLRALLHYDPETGVFTWLPRELAEFSDARAQRSWNTKYAGKSAGGLNVVLGYVLIAVDGGRYFGHRLAWLYMTGEWPSRHVDHIDGQGWNNRWSNLRDVSAAVNLQNQRRARSNSESGLLGVHLDKRCGRYRAQIRVSGKVHALGYHDTAEEAHAAYVEAKRRLHEGCTL